MASERSLAPNVPRRLMGARDVVAVLFLMTFWIIPVTYVGLAKGDLRVMPTWLRHQHRIACLFTSSVSSWSTYHIEVQRRGQTKWEELSEAGFFDMEVFGYRTRFHRIMSQASGRHNGDRRMEGVAQFIVDKLPTVRPDVGPISRIRFVRLKYTIDQLKKERGAFQKPLLKDDRIHKRTTLFEKNIFSSTERPQ